jgi:hypothetical protein
MKTIVQQLIDQAYFVPQWKIKHLFLGTFNPAGGEAVSYFYGRQKNFTWKILNEIFLNEFKNSDLNLRSDFFEKLEANEIACMDMIRSVQIAEQYAHLVTGKGYSDSKIINNKVIREYNTIWINKVIIANPGIKVYSTWGTGSILSNWVRELAKLEAPVIGLKSPSPVARVPSGTEKYNYVLADWRSKILV